MKLNYFGCALERHSTGDTFIFDINPFLQAFCALDDSNYKGGFHHGGENLYLIRLRKNIYLYLMSKSNEVVKKIRESDQSVTGILDLLGKNEKLGFASFVCAGDGFVGFASTILAPKAVSFGNFMNDLLSSLGLDDYKFVMRPLIHEATRSEAVSMVFMGKTTMELNRSSPHFKTIRKQFGCSVEDFNNVEALEISFKPKFKKDIKPAVKKALANTPQNGVEKFMIRAKESLSDQLNDLYVTGQGAVSSVIKKGTDYEVCDNIIAAVNDNLLLREKIKEYKQHGKAKFLAPKAIASIDSAAAWSTMLGRLQPSN